VRFSRNLSAQFSKDSIASLKPSECLANNCVLVGLEMQRRMLRQTIADSLQEPVASLVKKDGLNASPMVTHRFHADHSFGIHDAIQVSAYLRELSRLQVFPLDLEQMQILDVLEKLSSFDESRINSALGFPMQGRMADCTGCTFDARIQIDQLERTVMTRATGLCLDCMRHGPSQGSECRIRHGRPFAIAASEVRTC